MKKYAAELIGTFWLVLGGCGSAVLAAAFPNGGIGLLGVALAFGLTVLTLAYAGGAGSVIGDTTTTMMWIAGVKPGDVFEAYIAATVALVIFGIPAALQQQRFSPIYKDPPTGLRIDWVKVGIVAFILAAAIGGDETKSLGGVEKLDGTLRHENPGRAARRSGRSVARHRPGQRHRSPGAIAPPSR